MGFPTVKSDPWKKSTRRRTRHTLWPERFWRELVQTDKHYIGKGLSDSVREKIAEMNLLLYGKG